MPLGLIDGDVLCYHSCPSRWKDKHLPKVYDMDGVLIPHEFTKEEDEEYLRICWGIFQTKLKNIIDKLFLADVLMAVKSKENYRDVIYNNYKKNRSRRPSQIAPIIEALRTLAVMEGLAVRSTGREADDMLRIWAEESRRAKRDFYIITIDKDLKCIPGKYWNMKSESLEIITEDFARNFFYKQLLAGDSTDNIPGIRGIGMKTAEKILNCCKTENEYQEAVVDQYIRAYGDDWFSHFLTNGKLINIQKHVNDYFECDKWPIIQELI